MPTDHDLITGTVLRRARQRPFGSGLPPIRDWTEQHYDFAGYITGFDPRRLSDRQALG